MILCRVRLAPLASQALLVQLGRSAPRVLLVLLVSPALPALRAL